MFDIGDSLREARTRRGLSAADVQKGIRIRERYLTALEEERWELLPGEAYTKGFLRTYAEFLGLDGQLYVDEYSSRFVGDGFDDASPRKISPRVHQDRGIERKVLLLALAGIAALTALVIVAWKFGAGDSGTPAVVIQPPRTAAPAARGLKLTGTGHGSYIEVRRSSATGVVLLQDTLVAGAVQRIDGKRFWLYVRRPSGVRVALDGKAVALPAGRNLRLLVTPTRTSRASR